MISAKFSKGSQSYYKKKREKKRVNFPKNIKTRICIVIGRSSRLLSVLSLAGQ
jgi:hypothetical protein